MASPRPRISIEYCPRCGWMLRSAWLAQELLTTFEAEVGEVALIPSQQSGTFRIQVNDAQVWSRQADGGFPAAAELKRRVRDLVAPGRALGHGESGSRESSSRDSGSRESSSRDSGSRDSGSGSGGAEGA